MNYNLALNFIDSRSDFGTDLYARKARKARELISTDPVPAEQGSIVFYSDIALGEDNVQLFNEYKREWKNDKRYLSSLTDITSLPSYLRIIAMGRKALFLIFEELEDEPDYWFAALRAIFESGGQNIDPVNAADRGNLPRMSEAWLRWARANHYI